MSGEDRALALSRAIAGEFRRRMLEEYVPRIERCVGLLDFEQVWHRPNRHCNAVGNLLLHLEGNVRQWILTGLAGGDDPRDRDGEFAATSDTESANPKWLMNRLRETVQEAVDVVDGLGPDELLRRYTLQQRYQESGVGAVLHVMEHFSGHAGQIYALTKQLLDVDLEHYDL